MTAAYALTVDLLGITGEALAGIPVSVESVKPRLRVIGEGQSRRTLYPTRAYGRTDAAGEIAFNLLPSSVAGDYRARIGADRFRTFSMPARAARLSAL